METFFSMQGRLNRLRYFGYLFVIGLVTYIAVFVIGLAIGSAGAPDALQQASALGFLINLGYLAVSSPLIVKRLHDLNRPGTHFWLLLIPLYNIYLGLVLLLQKGTEGPNQYGSDPLAKQPAFGSTQSA